MASSSYRKATSSSPQRFYDYLNGLQGEYDRLSRDRSTKGSNSRRFNIFLGGLKVEFELMAEDMECLQKERDEYKEKAEKQARELLDVRYNFCKRCSTGTASAHGVLTLSQAKTPGKSDTWEVVTTRRQIQHMTPIQPSEAHATTKRPDTMLTHSQTVTLPSPIPHAPGSKQRDWSITFNKEVEKELIVNITHTLFHEMNITCLKFRQDGKYLAAGCSDGKAYVYDVRTGALKRVFRNLFTENGFITAVCFSHDGKYLATGSRDGGICIWEVNTKHVRNAFKGHTRWIHFFDFSPNDRLLVSPSHDDTVRLWNMRSGAATILTEANPTFLENASYNSAVFSPDGRYVAASHRDGMVRIWDVRTGQLMRRVKAHMRWATDIAFMPDGLGLVSGSWDNTLRYWDVSSLRTTRFRRRSQHDSHREVEEQTRSERIFLGHESYVCSLAISHDGTWVTSASGDRTVRIWHNCDATMQCILKHDSQVQAVDFSPAGSYLASSGLNGTVRIWRYSLVRPLKRDSAGVLISAEQASSGATLTN